MAGKTRSSCEGRTGMAVTEQRGGDCRGAADVTDVRHSCLRVGKGQWAQRSANDGGVQAWLSAFAFALVCQDVEVGSWPEGVGQGGTPSDDLCSSGSLMQAADRAIIATV